MKRFFAVTLFAVLGLTGATYLFGQKSSKQPLATKSSSEFARFEKVEALATFEGALVRWQMTQERANAGFMIYRYGEKGLEPVADSLLAGSFARSKTDTISGETYEIFDYDGTIGSTYVVEAWSATSGKRLLSKPVSAVFTSDFDFERITGRRPGLYQDRKDRYAQILADSLALPSDLSDQHKESLLPPDLNTHRWVVAQPGAKIGVRKDGMYRVTRAELQAAGFNVGSDSANWRLFMEGNEQAIIVGAGDQYIEFYGRGLDTVESDTRMYYLVADTVPGKRMQTRVLRNFGGTASSNAYRISAEKKERTTYIYDILNGDAENYWGRIVTTTPTTVPISLTGIDFGSNQTVTFTLKMKGFSTNAHQTRVVLNGNELAPISGQQQEGFSQTYSIPVSFLVEGNNSLQLNSTASGDLTMFDTATFNYLRKYQADQNKVPFFTPGLRKVDLGNFSSANVRLFDITFDGEPALITNLSVVQNGGAFTLRLPSSRAGIFYGVEDTGLLQSPTVTANNPSNLFNPSNAANLIIISHSAADFMAAAEAWANYRRNQGFTVKVVDVADIFDEFNYGVLSADSINSFLNYAKNNWSTQPNYVLLIGDGSYDSRNYEGRGYWNMVPPKMVNTLYTEAPSDEALADFDGDGLAELSIGRIPTRTAADITTVLNKTINFETAAMQSLNRGAIFAYDAPVGFDFAAMSLLLRNELSASMPAVMVDKVTSNATTMTNEINVGRYVVNWAGHGSTGLWGYTGPYLLSVTNVPSLTNGNDKWSLFIMLTCLNGYFIGNNESMAELLVKSPTGGAAASWASTGKTTPDVQLIMGQRFYQQLNLGSITRMGDLIKDAKTQIPFGADVRLSWVLLGDPMLKVR